MVGMEKFCLLIFHMSLKLKIPKNHSRGDVVTQSVRPFVRTLLLFLVSLMSVVRVSRSLFNMGGKWSPPLRGGLEGGDLVR